MIVMVIISGSHPKSGLKRLQTMPLLADTWDATPRKADQSLIEPSACARRAYSESVNRGVKCESR
jgi:hypothetical protein